MKMTESEKRLCVAVFGLRGSLETIDRARKRALDEARRDGPLTYRDALHMIAAKAAAALDEADQERMVSKSGLPLPEMAKD